MPTYRKGEDQFELEHAALQQSEAPVGAREEYRRSVVDKTLDNPNIIARPITEADHPAQGKVGQSHLYEKMPPILGGRGTTFPGQDIPIDIGTHISGADIMRARKRQGK